MVDTKKKYQNQFIFDYLKNILTEKSAEKYKEHIDDKENFKSFPFHVIIRYLSMCEDSDVRDVILKNQLYLERLDGLSHEKSYLWFLKNVKRQHCSFIKYIK